MALIEAQNPTGVLANGVKLVGESFLPGASLLMEGKFLDGAAHSIIGLGAKVVFGPLGLVLVCADSFAKATTQKSLWNYATDTYHAQIEKRKKDQEASAASTEAPAVKVIKNTA